MTDIYGSTYEADLLATGYGLHLAIPLLRKHHRADMSHDEAKALLEECMKVRMHAHICLPFSSLIMIVLTGILRADDVKLSA